jgi:hypothetical protein
MGQPTFRQVLHGQVRELEEFMSQFEEEPDYDDREAYGKLQRAIEEFLAS